MLVFHTHCQMANQMFIYACAYNLAQKKQTEFCLSDISDLKYFKLSKNEHLRNKLKYFLFRISNILFHNYTFLHLQDNFKYHTTTLSFCSKNTWFYGYFQGEHYFVEYKNDIRKKFEIKEIYKKEFQQLKQYQNLNKKLVAVHIRRNDYKILDFKELEGPDLSIPVSYYQKVLSSYINDNNYSIIFLSDEIDMVEKEFSFIKNAVFSKNKAIVDLQILINANILILANSSFSWWGAWLNNKPEKIIFVPKYFLGFKVKKEYPVNIIPDNWIQIDVNE